MNAPTEASKRLERRESEREGGVETPRRLFERLLVPIVDEADAEAVCSAIRPYVDPRDTQLVVVHVGEEPPGSLADVSPAVKRDRANAIFEYVREEFADAVHPIHTDLRYGTDILDEVFASADAFDATAIGVAQRCGNRRTSRLPRRLEAEGRARNGCPVVVFPRSDEDHGPREGVDRPHEDGDRDERRRLLVPIDGSEPSMKAVEYACAAHPDAAIRALYVLGAWSVGPRRSRREPANDRDTIRRVRQRERRREAEQLFREAKELAAEYDAELVTETAIGKSVPRAIVTTAENRDADRVVIGSRGRSGLARLLRGSVADAVLRRASIPVTVVPTPDGTTAGPSEINHVVVPVDGSSASKPVLAYVSETFPDAAVTAVHAVDPVEGYADSHGYSLRRAERWQRATRDRAERVLKKATKAAGEYGIDCSTAILTGTAPAAIASYAEECGGDHIVVTPRSRPIRTLSRSVSKEVVRQATVPVTVLPRSARTRSRPLVI